MLPYDFFISHASEDKDDVARPLFEELKSRGYEVWYDEFSLRVGDDLRREIDKGLASSRFGILVLSPNFFKTWPSAELGGLFSRQMSGEGKVILPIWHNIDQSGVVEQSPILAGLRAVSTTRGIPVVADEIIQAIAMPSPPKSQTASTPLLSQSDTFDATKLISQLHMSSFVLWKLTFRLNSLSVYGLPELYDLFQHYVVVTKPWPGSDIDVPIPDVFLKKNRYHNADGKMFVYKSEDHLPQFRNAFLYKMAVLKERSIVYSLIELDKGPHVPVRINNISKDFLCLCVLLERIHAAKSLKPNIAADLEVSLTDNGGFYVPEQDSIDVPPVLDRYQLTSGSFSILFDNFDRSSYQRFFRKLLGLFENTNPSGWSPFLELSQNRLDQWLRTVGSSAR